MGHTISKLHIGPLHRHLNILIIGLDHAGKTSILYRLKLNSIVSTVPTCGCQFETITHNNKYELELMDVGGSKPLRSLWNHAYLKCDAIIFVIDSSDRHRLNESQAELQRVLKEGGKQKTPVLVLANKQDVPNALNEQEIRNELNTLLNDSSRKVHIQPCSVVYNTGLKEGIDWLTQTCVHTRSKLFS
jgi:ADP-ribosylation factor protein 1